ncbi:RNA recognition motif. (a.k.a. RRM, RBD, or RNP domain) [Malonomonas rubra DSM 5091]|uniref:RNA recognition motif. (A.k.a. RRM, RBD, or RNP domain) n=1 Tax=Malonomonas rubra DSM 5091 TaxID=1122189 RepID=A0A1M6IUR1_MALRU|nr:RNA-binding protein [Malonomonas rubra]SHJ38144.1 RNA recognition motif. (a.k.a. RRM, RBD, or RNP domain) [Malonomonas rubra DSM 5091]
MKNRAKNKDLFVGEISFEAGEEDLRKLFAVCGEVKSVKLLTDQRSGKFTGRAFVRMGTDAQAKDAVQTLDGALLIDRCIRVSAAKDKPEKTLEQEETTTRRRSTGRGRRRS